MNTTKATSNYEVRTEIRGDRLSGEILDPGPLLDKTLESGFSDFKQALSGSEAEIEANRCLNCFDAPCIQACPTGINIPQFISRIATQNTFGAAKTILDSNILGQSCGMACPTEVLCEGACVYHKLNKQPILIGKLQRYAVETAYHRGVSFYQAGAPTGKRVALVGCGPASLACAHELRKQGHAAVIFEKTNIPGGLNTQGIAPYKMKASISLNEIEQIQKIGVEFQFEMELGKNLHLSELLNSYDAVFLGMGLGPDSTIPAVMPLTTSNSVESNRISGAVQWISELKTAPATKMNWVHSLKTALVVGGGNTALDACRELKELGVPKVIVSYRRGENEMSGYAHELKWARQAGVEFWFGTLPVQFRHQTTPMAPSPILATLQKTRVDTGGRIQLEDEKIDIAADLVLLATGQSKLEKLLCDVPGLGWEGGRLIVHPTTGQSGNPKIYAGGDLVNGGKEVVNAVAEGKRAALAIHGSLKQPRTERLSSEKS